MNEEYRKWGENMKIGIKGKGKGTVKINSALHTYIVYRLSERNLAQTTAAEICGCSVQFLNQVIQGKKKSEEIQKRLAVYCLGLRSWAHVEYCAQIMQENMIKIAFQLEASDAELIAR